MTTLATTIDQEQDFGQGLRKIAELAGVIAAFLGVTGFLIVFLVIGFILLLPSFVVLVEYYHWISKREHNALIKRLPSASQTQKVKLHRQLGEELEKLDDLLLHWSKNIPRRGVIGKYFYNKVIAIQKIGLASQAALIAATFPNAQQLGLNSQDTDRLRNDLAPFAQDWGAEELDEYDEIKAS